MDISEKYIEMCEKADEIQKIWQSMCNKQEGQNFYWNSHYDKGYEGSFYKSEEEVRCVDYEYPTGALDGNEDIWLPRQDQLQEMIVQYYKTKRFTIDITSVYFNVAQWAYNSFGDDKIHPYNTKKILGRKLTSDEFLIEYNKISLTRYSPEMIYLSYFMLVAHNKTWNGENWI